MSIFIIFALLKLITTGLVIYTFAITPNIAYSHSIINLNILITILASIIIFNQKLNYFRVISCFTDNLHHAVFH